MGLFDGLLQDPESLGVALGLLQGRGNGAGLLMQLGQSQAQKKQRALMEQLQRQQLEQGQMQMQMQKEAQARQQGLQKLGQQYFNPGDPGIPQPDAALGGGPGLPPTPMSMGAGFIPAAVQQGLMDPMQAMASMPKPESFTLKPGEVRYQGDKPVAKGGQDFNQMIVMGPNGPVLNPLYVQGKQAIAAAGKPQITTNTHVIPPDKRFDESLKFKKDFDSQPEVKGFKEVRAAWDQIDTALKRPSPANDLAAATKFMKLLDPGSVVRESELIMAMQASGKLDYFLNTANRILTGEKLTPKQRTDFHAAGKALFEAAKGRHDQTQAEYKNIAKDYNLDTRFMGQSAEWKILD